MSIYKKLFEAKKEIGKISKDSKNPFFKSDYLSLNGLLNAVEPVLEKHGLILLQPIRDGKVSTMILDPDYDDVKNDRVVYSDIELPIINDPQKLGSAITYYRRYTLQSLLGLQAEDDDGNKASNKNDDRKPALNSEQFEATKKGSVGQIKAVLQQFRMSQTQRDQLTEIVENGSV